MSERLAEAAAASDAHRARRTRGKVMPERLQRAGGPYLANAYVQRWADRHAKPTGRRRPGRKARDYAKAVRP
jgi:hypothetical protein